MKRILLLSLLLLPIVALAQYPTFSNKQKLGVQTTGDGLIYRGGIHPNYYTPSNINNAYFYLDTTTSKLYLYSVGTWQQIYPTASDTISLGAYLLKSDTSAMLLPYLRKSDTISLSNRINNKLSLADTASMLLPYLKLADTTSMLTPYFRDSDTTMLNLIARFNSKLNTTDTVSLSNRIDLKLNKTDTINLSNRIDLKLNKSDTISLSNRIDIKLNASDTVSLSNRINKKLDTLYINYHTYIDTITNKDTIQIAPSLVLTEGFGINVIGDSINIDSAVILATQQKQIAYVKNQSGVTMYKGQAVYSSGSSGDNKLVKLASSNTEQASSKTFGIVETDSIPNGGHGYIITFGVLNGFNTDALTEGSSVYLSSTPGQLTSVKPQAPLHIVTIGVCIRKQQNNGSIFVKIQNGFEFDELHDVRLTDLVDKASIYYNLSEDLWRDTTAALLVSDTVSMLSKYVNTYSNQTGINGDKTFNNVVTIDSATVTGKLLVNTNISDAVKINSNTNSTNLELMNSNGTVSIKSSNKNMILQTDTTALVYLNGDNKKVGILTMNPQQELEVNGNARITGLNNNLIPLRIVGSSNNNDLTNVNLGEGLSFANDTLKVDLTIIDTAIAASSITLVGDVSGSGATNSTVNTIINNGVVTNDMLAGSISDSKLNTITTAGKISNSATTATSTNTNSAIVTRDGSGNFSAGIITASLNGNASTATNVAYSGLTGTVPTWNQNTTGNAATVTSVLPSNFASQTANTVLAAPNGSNGTPTFRSLVSTDIPNLNYLPLTGGTLTGGLTGTTGSFITNNLPQLSLGISGIAEETRLAFVTGNIERFKIFSTNSQSSITFQSPAQESAARGYRFISSWNTDSHLGLVQDPRGNVGIKSDATGNDVHPNTLYVNGTLGVTSNITANSFIKSGGTFNQFLKADGTVDGNDYLTTSSAASIYYPKIGGTISGTINRQEGLHDGSTSTFYYNILNYFAKRDNNKGGQTAQITFTDRPGTSTFPNNVRTSDIYLMTAKNFSGGQLGQYLDTTLSIVANQDGGRIGISKLNPAYKLDVNGTLGVSGTTVLSSLQGTGTRMVVANSTGVLSTQAIPTGTLVGTDTVSLSNRINTKVGLTGNETINGTKTFGGLIVPTNGMQLTATGNNSNKLLGLNVSSIVGEITLGSGLSLSNNILSVTTTSGGFVTTNSDYAVTITDTWIVFNNNFSNITVTLPNAATSTGRTLYFRNTAAGSIVSAGTANIIDNTVTTGTPNNNILGAGNTNVKWCTLVSNGTYWIKMQAGSL